MVATFLNFDEALVLEVPNPRPTPGTGILNFYFGERGKSSPGPQAFIVNFGSGIGNRAHFHHVEQFQVFFGSSGSYYQRHEIDSLMVHYADSDTVYGPFGAGVEPLQYFTLRPRGDTFIGFLPEDRQELQTGVRRHFEIPLGDWLNSAPSGSGVTDFAALMPEFDDGLGAWRVMLPAGGSVDGLFDPGSGGGYCVVVEGSLMDGDRELPRLALGWVAPNSELTSMRAGAVGAKLLFLRFPASPTKA